MIHPAALPLSPRGWKKARATRRKISPRRLMGRVNEFEYARSQVCTEDATFSIGRLADLTGVPATALRYYDDRGLVRPITREAGRRRYDDTAITQVGVVLVLRDAGFTLAEIGQLVNGEHWHDLATRKLEELDALATRVQVARTALEHALACPHGDPSECPTFWSVVDARAHGRSLAEAHSH